MDSVVLPSAQPLPPPPADEDKYPRINEKFLRALLRSDMRIYYSTKELNDRLYLHYKGFHKIENLEPFLGLRVLYIEGNCIDKIEGLFMCSELRCLFMQENCIREITGLDTLVNLDTLNLSDNCLTRITGLYSLKKLSSLILQRNQIGANGIDDIHEVIGLDNLSVLDLAHNKCADPMMLPEVLAKLPALRVMYFTSNEITKKIPNYRKTMVHELTNLTFLDDRPVFPEDRRFVEAFFRGGIEAEREERKAFNQEKEEERLRNHLAFHAMIEDARARHHAGRPNDAGDDSGSQSTTIPSLPASSDEEAKSLSESIHNSSSSEAEEHKGEDVIEESAIKPVPPYTETHSIDPIPTDPALITDRFPIETPTEGPITDPDCEVPPLIEDVFITANRSETRTAQTDTPPSSSIWLLPRDEVTTDKPSSAPTFLIEEMVSSADTPPTFSLPMPSEAHIQTSGDQGATKGTQLDELD